MSSGEIVVNQTSLGEKIEALKNLLSGSGYSRNGTLLVREYGKTTNCSTTISTASDILRSKVLDKLNCLRDSIILN